ncbi:helix-turn-helix domain-containing protein [Pseudonocardia sp. RS11V-5]|uniref:helix-turn-helix domain-containing protein n=1 Tax=Pseudonocardia terrae TaxID=2905831 RepID=UPI001E29D7E9|nr:helix-turn-helix domain-containing protein [Pseudonocardia terrae]MCE3555136.1 helix-turn-helix domain-containing protein [Pseudonocardia terrae]
MTGYSSDLVEAADAHFGRRLRALREERGLSQQHVVNALLEHGIANWHQTTVAKIEAGTRPVRLSEAMACASLFDLTVDEMLIDPESEEARDRWSRELSARRRELDLVEQLLLQRRREIEDAQARLEDVAENRQQDPGASATSEPDTTGEESAGLPPSASRSFYSKSGPEWGTPAAYGWDPDNWRRLRDESLPSTKPENRPGEGESRG